jgi:hypothetical protein
MDATRLRELAAAATPGKWVASRWPHSEIRASDSFYADYIVDADWNAGVQSKCDADYIAAACPVTILALLARMEAAEHKLHHATMAADAEARRVDELTAMLRAAEQDAARYRYIRDNMCSRSEPPYLLTEWEDLSGLDSEIDKRIDAARREG